jgi:predicted amidohydrolase
LIDRSAPPGTSQKKRDRKIYFVVMSAWVKACALTAEASGAGARLIAFPESFVPSFPVWAAAQAPIKSPDFFKRLAANSTL